MKVGLMKSGCHIMNYLETGELSFLMLEKKLNYFEFQIKYWGEKTPPDPLKVNFF